MNKHTDTPWEYQFNKNGGYDCTTDSYDIKSNGKLIAELDLSWYGQSNCEAASRETLQQAESNAAYIVRCVNAHEALVNSLKEIAWQRKTNHFNPEYEIDKIIRFTLKLIGEEA